MKKTIIEIEKLATLLFDDKTYNKFIAYINEKNYNNARLLVEQEIELLEDSEYKVTYGYEFPVADSLLDLIIDLIIMNMDGEREQVESNIRRE